RGRSPVVAIWDADPSRARRLGSHEGDPVPAARTEAEIPLPRERLEQRAPAGPQLLGDVRELPAPGHLRDELLAAERAIGQSLLRGLAEELHERRRHPEVLLPALALPRPAGGEQREVRAAFLGREEVERSPHRPGL